MADGSVSADNNLFGNIRRLVPASGIQFLDATIETRRLPYIRAWFTEDQLESASGPRRFLLPLSNDASVDGTIWHPVTFKPLGPADAISFTGLEALQPFLDSWTPVPYLRYLGRSEAGQLCFDKGPSNWARVFVAKPDEGLRGATDIKVVFAFDTRLATTSRSDLQPYLAPNVEDATFASTFMLADDPEALSEFLGVAWLDAWIRESCRSANASREMGQIDESGFTAQSRPDPRFTLAHIGQYLAFLRLLAQTSGPPQLRFIDTVSQTARIGTSPVDLVIDFGTAQTTALLVDRDRIEPADMTCATAQSMSLRLRDLDRPQTAYSGSIPTALEFDQQTFGNAALSRRSGRNDAFQWPSLVRVGHEAQRLALRTNALEGVTGLSDVAGQITNTEPSSTVWRFSTPDMATAIRSAPMVSGEALRHLTEIGDVVVPFHALTSDGNAQPIGTPTVRPRFSQSSLMGLYVVELLIHAIREVNSPSDEGALAASPPGQANLRHIERVVLMSPLAMSAHERQLLVERVQGAIDLLWRSQEWDQAAVASNPIKPQLSMCHGPDVGLQLVYLFNEIATKFGGGFSHFVDCVRRRAGEPDARDNLRISSIELSSRSAGLTVIDYDLTQEGSVQAALVLTDRIPIGGERVIEAIVERHLFPAIELLLAESGLSDAHQSLVALLTDRDSDGANSQSVLGTNLLAKILRPVANAVFEIYAAMPRRGAEGLQNLKLADLIEAGGGKLDPVATQFNQAAATIGARGFDLATATFEIGRRQMKERVETEVWPTINAFAEKIKDSEADILLLVGDLAQLPDLLDHIVTLSPVPAGRILALGPKQVSQAPADIQRQDSTQASAVLGAYLASQNRLQTQGFALTIRSLTRAMGPQSTPLPNVPHLSAIDKSSPSPLENVV